MVSATIPDEEEQRPLLLPEDGAAAAADDAAAEKQEKEEEKKNNNNNNVGKLRGCRFAHGLLVVAPFFALLFGMLIYQGQEHMDVWSAARGGVLSQTYAEYLLERQPGTWLNASAPRVDVTMGLRRTCFRAHASGLELCLHGHERFAVRGPWLALAQDNLNSNMGLLWTLLALELALVPAVALLLRRPSVRWGILGLELTMAVAIVHMALAIVVVASSEFNHPNHFFHFFDPAHPAPDFHLAPLPALIVVGSLLHCLATAAAAVTDVVRSRKKKNIRE